MSKHDSAWGDNVPLRPAAETRSEPVRASERSVSLRAAPLERPSREGAGLQSDGRRGSESRGEGGPEPLHRVQEEGEELWCPTCDSRTSQITGWTTVLRHSMRSAKLARDKSSPPSGLQDLSLSSSRQVMKAVTLCNCPRRSKAERRQFTWLEAHLLTGWYR